MSGSAGLAADVAVVGAGALGAATAAELAAMGARVLLIDRPGSPNASSVAAGMLAPAFESVLEEATPERAALLKGARDLWPELAARTGVELIRDGAAWAGPEPRKMAERLRTLGFKARLKDGKAFTSDDWRLVPSQALAALIDAPGVRYRRAQVEGLERSGDGWELACADGEPSRAARVVVATGVHKTMEGPRALKRTLARVSLIKGQIARVRVTPPPCVLRGEGVYVVPDGTGVLVGATMEPGQRDLLVDERVITELIRRASVLWPPLATARAQWARAGVRGATPDGLPLAGEIEDGLFAALAPRRNGWLLAAMIARITTASLSGRKPDEDALRFSPSRF
ncbi:FAD-dependent oxidoreductase [Brevundimonas sp. 2R-24]|uniref:FAD-dependent oxidoreductase n=1 Tax=Peiella sedimenti TaxID=3061083 RepID=A0ABT8SJW9_9CAUL|nr:FAD-dependent oxidoreductase [Caulobacteraceae bacterium XZ-24]